MKSKTEWIAELMQMMEPGVDVEKVKNEAPDEYEAACQLFERVQKDALSAAADLAEPLKQELKGGDGFIGVCRYQAAITAASADLGKLSTTAP